jgi:hypothetical protein
MGMRIGNNSGASATQSAAIGQWQQRQQSFKDLSSALKSGDLGAAQTAFAALGGKGSTQGSAPLAQIGQALQNGDLAGAQQAFQALQTARAGHSHHHGGGSSQAPAPAPSAPISIGVGSLVNVTA